MPCPQALCQKKIACRKWQDHPSSLMLRELFRPSFYLFHPRSSIQRSLSTWYTFTNWLYVFKTTTWQTMTSIIVDAFESLAHQPHAPLTQQEKHVFKQVQNALQERLTFPPKEWRSQIKKKEMQQSHQSKVDKVKKILQEMKSLTKPLDDEEQTERLPVIFDNVCFDHDYAKQRSILPDLSSDDDDDDKEDIVKPNTNRSSSTFLNMPSLDSILLEEKPLPKTTIEVVIEDEEDWSGVVDKVRENEMKYNSLRCQRTKNKQLDYQVILTEELKRLFAKTSRKISRSKLDIMESEHSCSRQPVKKQLETPVTKVTPIIPKRKLMRIDHNISKSIEVYEKEMKEKVNKSDERVALLHEVIQLRKLLYQKESALKINKKTRTPRRSRPKIDDVASSGEISSQGSSVSVELCPNSPCLESQVCSPVPSHASLDAVPSPTPSCEGSIAISLPPSLAFATKEHNIYESYIESVMRRDGLNSSKASSSGYSQSACSSNTSGFMSPALRRTKHVNARSITQKVMQWKHRLPREDSRPKTPPTPLFWTENASDITGPRSPINFDGLDFWIM